ncbi:uncharacterized protein [Rutidosis leptorrhynchoides]|uniref:uncharacterized protein isoform X1 n=1 Tax=Rutidosis leptorrhynchoides TaxID=125765 RepID=UPI003A994CB8
MEDYRKHVFCSTSLNSPIALFGLPYKVEWHIRKGKERSQPVNQCYNVKLVTHLHAPGCPLVQIWMRLVSYSIPISGEFSSTCHSVIPTMVFCATYLNSTFSLFNCCIKATLFFFFSFLYIVSF